MQQNNTSTQEPLEALIGYINTAPGLVGGIARQIYEQLDTEQPGIALSTALSFIAALKCRRIIDGNLCPNLYTLSIAPSGVGKTTAQHIISDMCSNCGLNSLLMGRPASDSGILKRLQTTPRQFLIWDEFGLAFSEMTQSQSSYRVAIIETIMDLFSASGRVHIGKEYANQERIDIVDPALSICAASTPDRFFDALNKNFVTDGFLGRWLIFPPEDSLKFKDIKKQNVDFSSEILAIENIGADDSLPGNLSRVMTPKKVNLKINEELRVAVKSFFQSKSGLAKSSLEQALWRRGNEQVLKLCMIVADIDGNCSDQDLAWCWGLVKNLIARIAQKCETEICSTKSDKAAIERAEKFKMLIEPGQRLSKADLTRAAGGRGYGRQEREWRTKDLLESGEWAEQVVKSDKSKRITTFYFNSSKVYSGKKQNYKPLNDLTILNDSDFS